MISRGLVSPHLRQRIRGVGLPVALALGRVGLTPNALTVIGFAGTCVAAWAAATGSWVAAGVLVVAFGVFDMLDGALARATGRATRFGAFLDSTLDRTGESLVLAGVAVAAAAGQALTGVLLAGLAIALASGVTYTRARAESLGVRADVGFAPREVRLVVLASTLILTGVVEPGPLDAMFPMAADASLVLTVGLGLITILSAATIVQRILFVKRELEQQENP